MRNRTFNGIQDGDIAFERANSGVTKKWVTFMKSYGRHSVPWRFDTWVDTHPKAFGPCHGVGIAGMARMIEHKDEGKVSSGRRKHGMWCDDPTRSR